MIRYILRCKGYLRCAHVVRTTVVRSHCNNSAMVLLTPIYDYLGVYIMSFFFGAWLLRMAEEQKLTADSVEGCGFFDAVLSEMEELYASGLHFKEKGVFDKVKTALVAKA